ncbi:MAG: hypothetical protein Kow00121_68780 [Elainellaceae cyanobacterium]
MYSSSSTPSPTVWELSVQADEHPTRRNTLRLAKQGNADAIAALMNQALAHYDITAQVNLQQDCLWILLEGKQVPSQQEIVPFIYAGISKLVISSINVIRVYGRRYGDHKATWSQEMLAPAQPQITPLKPSETDSPTVHYLKKIAEQRISQAKSQSVAQPFPSQSRTTTHLRAVPDAATTAQAKVIPVKQSVTARQPVTSQIRLMGLLKVLAMVALLVAGGSLWQMIDRLDDFRSAGYPWSSIAISLVMLVTATIALFALFSRSGIHLHPKHAQCAYVRLGCAFLINVATAFVLMVLVGTGLLVPELSVILPLFIGCILVWVWGCSSLARAKGYSRYWGILGLLLIDGAILLSLFPDRLVARRSLQFKRS